MRHKMKMSEVIGLMILDLESQGYSKRTLENYRHVLARLHRQVGDIYPANLQGQDFATYFAARPKGPGVRVDHSCLRVFITWCQTNGHIGRFDNPMEGRKVPSFMPTQKRRLHVSQFDHLLDTAGQHHPRDRITVALGLFLFLRASEIKDLRIKDVDLDAGFVDVRVFKTRQVDQMPICLELDRELRRWLTYYTEEVGQPLQDPWHLVPSVAPRVVASQAGKGRGTPINVLRPQRPTANPAKAVQRALEGIGWDLRSDNNDPLREGVHTLRRSGARALFDHLVTQSYDGALRRVQAMLHHADSKMTEHYLGIEIDRQKRNELIRGVPMFPLPDAGVVQLRVAGG